MALLFPSSPYNLSLPSKNPNQKPISNNFRVNPNSLSFSLRSPSRRLGLVLSSLSSEPESQSESDTNGDPTWSEPSEPDIASITITDEWGEKPESVSDTNADPTRSEPSEPENAPITITDEWGEKSELEPEPATMLADSDPPRNEDEWEESVGNGGPVFDPVGELKRRLLDTVYGSEFGFRAGSDVRAEVLELVNQLEALNPTPEPVEAPDLLDGNWVLLYTAFSELLPLLAAGATPLLKVESIRQSIDSRNLSIVNSAILSGPFATFSFGASAAFEVRSSSRIQVSFKEGTVQPPEIKSSINLPENIEVFGQKLSLSPVQQALNPLQEVAANISRVISGLPPFRLPIPGDRSSSWLLTTYLDKDLRISRGDGGLFVLAREGSTLLQQ